MTYHFRNLVFEGDGVKGIAYVGRLETLAEIRRIPWDLDFERFVDDERKEALVERWIRVVDKSGG